MVHSIMLPVLPLENIMLKRLLRFFKIIDDGVTEIERRRAMVLHGEELKPPKPAMIWNVGSTDIVLKRERQSEPELTKEQIEWLKKPTLEDDSSECSMTTTVPLIH